MDILKLVHSGIPMHLLATGLLAFITSNCRHLSCPIVCTDIYSQCYFVHWHLQQCLTQSNLLDDWMPYLSAIASNVTERLSCLIVVVPSQHRTLKGRYTWTQTFCRHFYFSVLVSLQVCSRLRTMVSTVLGSFSEAPEALVPPSST